MLRDFAAAVRASRRVRLVSTLAVAAVLVAAGCGIKGPLRPATPPAPATAPAPPPEAVPPAPPTEPDPTTPRKP